MSAALQAEKAELDAEVAGIRASLNAAEPVLTEQERDEKKARFVQCMQRLAVVNNALSDAGLLE